MNLAITTLDPSGLLAQLDPDALSHLRLDLTFRLDGAPAFPECVPRSGLPGLLELIQAKAGAEVGVQRGEFSAYLLENWPGTLYLVDPWEHQVAGYDDVANVDDDEQEANYQTTLDAMKQFPGRHYIVRGFSPCAADLFDDEDLDFVFLDGNHSYETVSADLAAWWPKLRAGGLMAGHDFMDYDGPLGSFRVRSAVLDFAGGKALRVYASREPWPSLWYFVKKANL